MFVDGHERPDVIENCEQFLTRMKEMEPYLVEFREDGTMKEKDYLLDCAVGGENCRPIIVITYDDVHFPQMIVFERYGLKWVKFFYD